MPEKDGFFTIDQQKTETVIIIQDELSIYHSEKLKELLLQAVNIGKALRIDLSNIEAFDLSVMQILIATKKSAKENSLAFIISPVSEKAKTILTNSGLSCELIS